MRNYILIGISVVTGLLAFFIAKAQIDEAIRKSGINDRKIQVLVVKRDMIAGEEMKLEHLRYKEVSPADIDKDAILFADYEKIIGRRVITNKKMDSSLQWSDFDILGDRSIGGVLAGVVKKSYRALSLPVDVPASVSNMIQPNDHVDVLGTFRFPAAEKGTQMDTVTLTILQNVTVLAVGQQLTAIRGAATDRRGNYSTLTLSVTPKEAEMLVFAQQKGVLTFTLRNSTDPYVARDVQDVNFEYLHENIKKYTEDRGTRETLPVTTPRRGP